MISVEEALAKIHEHATPQSSQQIPTSGAAGFVLKGPIHCTTDSPPFDKSQVDGFAVRTSDIQQAGSVLRIVEEIMAGQVPKMSVLPGTTIRIMTGAPVPAGADAIVMVERTELVEGGVSEGPLVRISESPRSGQNILLRGESMRVGDVVLRAGHALRAIEIGLLAELGVTSIEVYRQPTVAILSTGDELVSFDHSPGPGQIRNSNGPMLEALVREAGAQPNGIGIARDNLPELTATIRTALNSDVVLLSGGVSAGVLDLVPGVLQELGVQEIFHKVHLKPGKPLWFGSLGQGEQRHLVFGLPGNPVSSLVCFYLFVRPALASLAGRDDTSVSTAKAKLSVPFRHRGDRPTYFPARARQVNGDLFVKPLGWRGSSDLRTLVDANALICLEPGNYDLLENSPVKIHWL